MKKLAVVFLFFSSIALPAAVDYFSDAPRAFKSLLADPREAQFRVGYLKTGEKNSYLDMVMGGQLNIVNIILENGHILNIGLKGLISSRFQFASKSFDLQNSDYIGGLTVVFGRNTTFLELFHSHQSSHFGDDLVASNPAIFKNYSYESVRLLFSKEFVFPLRVYGGPKLIYRADPEELLMKSHIILGATYFPELINDLYFALNFESKQENDWTVDSAFTVGYMLGEGAKVQRRQRLFLEIYNGYSPMGQLSKIREFSVLAGFAFTL